MNVIAPFLLTSLLLPALQASSHARVLFTSSISQVRIACRPSCDPLSFVLFCPWLHSMRALCWVIFRQFIQGSADVLKDPQLSSGWSAHSAYAFSKLANAMIAVEMHSRYGRPPALTVNTMVRCPHEQGRCANEGKGGVLLAPSGEVTGRSHQRDAQAHRMCALPCRIRELSIRRCSGLAGGPEAQVWTRQRARTGS